MALPTVAAACGPVSESGVVNGGEVAAASVAATGASTGRRRGSTVTKVEHGNSSGQPAQSRQSDADIVPQAPQPPHSGAYRVFTRKRVFLVKSSKGQGPTHECHHGRGVSTARAGKTVRKGNRHRSTFIENEAIVNLKVGMASVPIKIQSVGLEPTTSRV